MKNGKKCFCNSAMDIILFKCTKFHVPVQTKTIISSDKSFQKREEKCFLQSCISRKNLFFFHFRLRKWVEINFPDWRQWKSALKPKDLLKWVFLILRDWNSNCRTTQWSMKLAYITWPCCVEITVFLVPFSMIECIFGSSK